MRSARDNYSLYAQGKMLVKASVLILWALIGSVSLQAQDFKIPERPDPPKLVNDMAGILGAGEASALESKLVAYNDSTSTQIAIVTINTLDGGEIAQYATELFHKWGIGQKGKDNGVLLLIAKDDHKLFIATGRGVEEYLPDAICKRIVNQDITPAFKAGNFALGINAGVDKMMARLSGTYVNEKSDEDNPAPTRVSPRSTIRTIFIIIVIIFIIISFFGGNGGRTYSSGGAGKWWLLFSILNSLGNSGRGSGGGGWSGGGGGGFGGFGGGDSGGGGAGGSW